MSGDPCELTVTERAAVVTRRLYRGERLTNNEIAQMCGYVDRSSAYYLMMRLARVLPVTFAEGRWYIIEDDM